MNLKHFKTGRYVQQYQYQSFTPAPVNHTWVWEDPQINTLLESATRSLGELNAFSLILPDADLFIYMHIVKEANTSSRIEGTQTSLEEVLMKEEDIRPEKRDDWREVQNYVQAMNYALEELQRLPLSNRLIRESHRILMQGARGSPREINELYETESARSFISRGEHKTPGEFRKSQNWIGGSSLSDAVFMPPSHEEVPELMSDLEKFLHNEEINVPHLIKIAIGHYQFETIHPFLDGNGRIGRLLITLYLVSNRLLKKPSLYLSDSFERHRPAYYDALSRVREANDLAHWIKFFLNGVIQTAEKGKTTFNEILELKNEVHQKIISLGRRAENAQQLINYLYHHPIVDATDVTKLLNISSPSAYSLLKQFEDFGWLYEYTGFKRNKKYYFKRYYEIF